MCQQWAVLLSFKEGGGSLQISVLKATFALIKCNSQRLFLSPCPVCPTILRLCHYIMCHYITCGSCVKEIGYFPFCPVSGDRCKLIYEHHCLSNPSTLWEFGFITVLDTFTSPIHCCDIDFLILTTGAVVEHKHNHSKSIFEVIAHFFSFISSILYFFSGIVEKWISIQKGKKRPHTSP